MKQQQHKTAVDAVEYPGAQEWADHSDRIVRVWIERSKDLTRTRAERDYAWNKALERATDAPGYRVDVPNNGRAELHQVIRTWAGPTVYNKAGRRIDGRMAQTVRIYRTREDGKPRSRRIGGA